MSRRSGSKRLMRWMGAAALAAGAALASAAPAHAQAVVVRATGPSKAEYPAGKRLPQGGAIELKAGDEVTVLDKAGTRVLRGAGRFTLDGAVVRSRNGAAMLARALSNPAAVRAGAVRGPGGGGEGDKPIEPIAASVWLADVDQGGRVCVPTGSDLYLWRGSSTERRYTWLGEADGGATVRLLWPQKTAGLAWPTALLPLGQGRKYRLTDEAAPTKATEFEVVMLDPANVAVDAAGLAAQLLDNGCSVQFEWLANSLERIEQAEAEPGI